MKKGFLAFFLSVAFAFMTFACRSRNDQVDISFEDGVEVVQNHLQPYRLSGAPKSVRLAQELTIDTERNDLAEKGITDIWGFVVNTRGEVFIYQPPLSAGPYIFKFDGNGNFVASFAPKGQGPGEIQRPIFHKITADDKIPVLDMGTNKLRLYDSGGAELETRNVPFDWLQADSLCPLPDGKYLYKKIDPRDPSGTFESIKLIDREFQEIKELWKSGPMPDLRAASIEWPPVLAIWDLVGDKLFLSRSGTSYEIEVYDFQGRLRRKIRKEFASVPYPESKKNALFAFLEKARLGSLKDKLAFPNSSPPFQHIFGDDKGRLYVMTYEAGEKPGEYLCDIFNSDGIFFARMSCAALLWSDLSDISRPADSWISVKNGRLYALREKASGYKEIVVYRMIWD